VENTLDDSNRYKLLLELERTTGKVATRLATKEEKEQFKRSRESRKKLREKRTKKINAIVLASVSLAEKSHAETLLESVSDKAMLRITKYVEDLEEDNLLNCLTLDDLQYLVEPVDTDD